MELNQAQNSFYINPDNGFKVPPAQRTLKRADSVVDNDAMLEVRMTQCSSSENVKTGYLKRSQCYELAILRPFLAIFPQTTLSTNILRCQTCLNQFLLCPLIFNFVRKNLENL